MSAEHKEKMLRRIAHSPRNFEAFSEGKVHSTVSARHLLRYLNEMIEDGLIRFDGDLYRITSSGRASLEPVNIVPPRCYGPMSTQGGYVPPAWPVRAGSEAFLECKRRTSFTSDLTACVVPASTVSEA